MGYTEVIGPAILLTDFISYDDADAGFKTDRVCGLFVRFFGSNGEINVAAHLLDTEIAAFVKVSDTGTFRSGFFLEHSSGKEFERFEKGAAGLAETAMSQPKKTVSVFSGEKGDYVLSIPVFLNGECTGCVLVGRFFLDGRQPECVTPDYPVITAPRMEYAVSQICANGRQILEYCCKYVVEEGFEPKLDYMSIFKYGNYYDFNLVTDTYMLSCSTGEILGLRNREFCTLQEFYDMVVPEDKKRVKQFLQDNVLIGGKTFTLETRIIRQVDKKSIWIEIKGVVIKDENGFAARVIGSVLDITVLKEIHEKLQQEIAAKNRLMRIIGHDLKNPFNALIGFSELLGESISEENYSDAREYVSVIKKSAAEGYDLLVNLLDYSVSISDGVVLEPSEFRLRNITESVTVLLSAQALRKSVSIFNKVPENIVIKADECKISTVVRNLVSNAVKFSAFSQPVVISAEETKDGKTKVSVSNTGQTIPADRLEKINSGAVIESLTGTGGEKGTGVGLMLCRSFLKLHGSTLKAESENSKTVFSFVI